jgi:hypothetical protein
LLDGVINKKSGALGRGRATAAVARPPPRQRWIAIPC